MPPRFSLQSILDYHHSRVEVLEVELGRMIQSRQEIMDLLMGLMKDQERMMEELKELQSGELDLQTIQLIRYNIHRLQENIEKQQKALKLLEQAIDAKQMEVVQARQDEAIFDKLKEKELQKYNNTLIEQDKVLTDDIYVSKAHKNSNSHKEEEN